MTSAESHQAAPGTASPLHSASIIIPVHNKATITRQCLDALLAEPDDGLDREIIVVDDGSSDLTPWLLAGYGSAIRVIHHETALGFAGACNAGAAAATGEFLVLLNNDTIPTSGWLANLVAHAVAHPEAAVVGVKLLFPNDTVQHAGVVFGLDLLPHHIYIGFPADHPATAVSRRFQVVTAACALFRRETWAELGGLDTAYRNGWEDVDFCLRAGEAGHEIHYCAESVLYHLESATRDLLSTAERGNQELFRERWQDKIVPDDFGYYWMDGLLSAHYGARYPIQLSVSPHLAGVTVGDNERLADKLLYDRSRQVMILLRNNIVLNVRVQEAEARLADAERRLADALLRVATATGHRADDQTVPRPASDAPTTTTEASPPMTEAPDETPESDSPPLPHLIVGMVESPGRLPDVITDGVLIVSGWAMTAAGDVMIEAIIDGESRGTVSYGESRLDAAALYPGYPAGEHCGFRGKIAVHELLDGMHELTVRISASDGAQAELTTTFEVDHHAFETGRVIGRLDLPVRGSLFLSRETIVVSGWVLAPSGIQSLEVQIDGETRGRVDYGALRPDIAERRRQYADADHCGFSGTVPLYGLAEGHHELVVRATANDGRQLLLPTRIEIDSALSIDGGVPVINRYYGAWLERRQGEAVSVAQENAAFDPQLTFGAIVPVSGDVHDALEAIAASLHAQTNADWKLILVDAGDASPDSLTLARQLAEEDARICIREASDNGAIADLNAAMAQGDADWVTFLAPGVILAPTALACIAHALTSEPDARLVYTDDDHIDPDTMERWNPFFKPDWSPDLLLAMNYLGPLTLFHRETAVTAGGLRDGFRGAESYDLALRLTDDASRVLHVPDILVTSIEQAPKHGEPWNASDWLEEERQAITDALKRRGVEGSVECGIHPGTWRVRYAMTDLPRVTAVIPTGGNLDLLRPCLDDVLHRTVYPNLDILLVDNSSGSGVEELVAELSERHPNVRRVVDSRKPFNYSALINAAIPFVNDPYVLMLNDDITVIDPGWLQAMVEHAQRPEVGIVGAKLLYPDDTIQHAGVILGPFGGSVHIYKRMPGDDPGFFNLPDVVRNCSAVTFACALIDRAVFDAIGGLDEEHLPVAFNDTDFCLRAREAGYEVIYTPHATLHHHESVTKTVIAHAHEIEYLRERWGHFIAHDPYYNPNLTRQGDDARLNMETTSAA
jgi:GT2 family glycosyltransferase